MKSYLIFVIALLSIFCCPCCKETAGTVTGISEEDGKFFLVDSIGERISPYPYEDAFFTHNMIVAKSQGKYGLLDHDGETMIGFVYESLEALTDNTLLAEKDGNFSIVDIRGNTLSKRNYESFRYCFNKTAIVSSGGRYGMIDIFNSDELLPIEYDLVEYCTDNLAIVRKDKNIALVNDKGDILAKKKIESLSNEEGKMPTAGEMFLLMETAYLELEEQNRLYWDAILDRYQALCDDCIELRTLADNSGSLPRRSISSLLEQSALLKEALSSASGSMTESQMVRFEEIKGKYTYLTQ